MRYLPLALLLFVGCALEPGDDAIELEPGSKADGDTSVELRLTRSRPSARAIVRCNEWFSCNLLTSVWTPSAVPDRRSAKVTITRSTDEVQLVFDAVSVACRGDIGPPVFHYMLPAGSTFSQWCDTVVLPQVTWARASSSDPREQFEITVAFDRWEPGLDEITWSLAARWQ